MSTAVEDATSYLKGNADGTGNVHDHLSQVILKLFSEGHSDALELLEQVSVMVKTGAKPRDAPERKPAPAAQPAPAAAAASAKPAKAKPDWITATLNLYPGTAEDEDELPDTSGTAFRDIMADANTLKWAGISLGKETMYNLTLAMKRVAEKNADENPLAKLQFWGKILGTKADYIILQGELEAPPEAPETPEGADPVLTPEGSDGANQYTYWVANSVEGEFIQLPNVTPTQILAAKQLKRLFTGNLDTVVGGHPPFPGGTEAGLLRAVIAHITAATHVIPKDVLKPDEEDPWIIAENEEDPDEEWVPPTTAQLSSSLDQWQLLNPGLNADGRVRNVDSEDADDEDEEGEPKEPVTQEFPPLGPLPKGDWGITRAGQRGCVRSTVWPGAVGLASGKYYVNVYIGYGVSSSNTEHSYCPPFPWTIVDEQSDKNISEAPDVLEAPLPPPTEEGEENEEEEEY